MHRMTIIRPRIVNKGTPFIGRTGIINNLKTVTVVESRFLNVVNAVGKLQIAGKTGTLRKHPLSQGGNGGRNDQIACQTGATYESAFSNSEKPLRERQRGSETRTIVERVSANAGDG